MRLLAHMFMSLVFSVAIVATINVSVEDQVRQQIMAIPEAFNQVSETLKNAN